jgi:hypothetical protein
MKTNRSLTLLAALICALPLGAQEAGVDAEPPCEAPVPWSEPRYIAEDNLTNEEFVRSEEYTDPALVETVNEYFEAWQSGDVRAMLLLHISLSDSHARIEEERLEEATKKLRLRLGESNRVFRRFASSVSGYGRYVNLEHPTQMARIKLLYPGRCPRLQPVGPESTQAPSWSMWTMPRAD